MNSRFPMLFGLLALVIGASCCADSYDERRLRMGARYFRALLAADVNLPDKVDSQGRLRLLIYSSDQESAAEIARIVSRADEDGASEIRGLPVFVDSADIAPDDGPIPAGIFLAEAPDEALLESIVQWSIEHHVIVYSPFEGHVEKGILGGLAVEARVRPYLNRRTMRAAGVELKPFFLKVAKTYP